MFPITVSIVPRQAPLKRCCIHPTGNGESERIGPETWLNHILSILPILWDQTPEAVIYDLLPWTEDMRRRFRI